MDVASMDYNEINNNIDQGDLIIYKKESTQDNMLILQDINVRNIIKGIIEAKYQEDPFYVCNLEDIVQKYLKWKEMMPRVMPFYAVKCNDSEVILKVLAALGTGFDCASKGEINKVLNLGVSPNRIIFANPTKPKSHIQTALKNNIPIMTFDSDFELKKIKYYYPNAKLVLRFRCEAEIAQCPLGPKFGCDPMYEAPQLIKLAQEEEMDLIGVSFHVGSGCMEPPVFRRAIKIARDLFDLAKTYGMDCNLLDIGGGFPGDDINTNILKEIADTVNNALNDFFPDPDINVIAEPGRYFVASAYTLACSVDSRKNTFAPIDGTLKQAMYFINDGVYGSFNNLLYDHQIVKPEVLHARDFDCELYPSTIWGPTCDSLDKICENVYLPDLNIGEWIIFENMGAYTIPVASPFNGFALPTVKYYISEELWEKMNTRNE